MGNYMTIARNPDGAEVTYRWPICKLVSQIRTNFSYLVVVLMWICAFTAIGGFTTTAIGVYLLFFSIPLTALEFSQIFMMCCTMFPEEGKFCHFWHFMLRLDGWRRGVFYILVALPMFLPGFSYTFAVLVGLLLFALGILYVATKFTVMTFTIPPPATFAQTAGGPAAYNPTQPNFTSIPPYNN